MRALYGFALVAILATGASAVPTGLVGMSSSNPGVLYSVNSSTGAATPFLTLSNETSFSGFEILGGVGYATDVLGFTGGGFRFASVDLTTGIMTSLSNQDGSANWWGLARTPGGMLWTVDQVGSVLKVVDPTDGSTTSVGATGIANNGSGLAYDAATATLYAMAFDGNLYTLNTATGASTLVGATGLALSNVHQGLVFDPTTGTLYMNEADTFDSLYTLNTTTGLATLVGANGAVAGFGIDGLTFNNIPEPSSIALLGLGLLGLGGASYRRRRKATA